MAAIPLLFLLLFLHQPSASSSASSSLSDSGALLLLKSSFLNPNPALSSWSSASAPANSGESSASPCTASWIGVLCLRGFVTGLRLAGLGLQGTINVDALSHFRSLRSISFNNNNLSGPLPNIGRLDALKSIYLSNNRFAGPIDDSLFLSMDHLKKLWLDGNLLSGRIPSSLSKVSMLIDLRLEGNNFTGEMPELQLSSLRYFNVSDNDLQGPIPISLAHFGAAAFAGNPNLCGPPLPGPACPIPTAHLEAVEQREGDSNSGKLVLIVLGILLAFLALVIGYAAVKSRRHDQFSDSFVDHHDAVSVSEAMEAAAAASPVQLPSASSSRRRSKKRGGSNRGSGGGSHRGGGSELVMVNDEKGVFGLPDLMRASAEVLGNGGLGSVYKAAMDNGVSVAVKRMRELNRLNKEGFDREMRRLGRLQHPNLLPPLAYHFRKEEKLVVSEYVAKGSLRRSRRRTRGIGLAESVKNHQRNRARNVVSSRRARFLRSPTRKPKDRQRSPQPGFRTDSRRLRSHRTRQSRRGPQCSVRLQIPRIPTRLTQIRCVLLRRRDSRDPHRKIPFTIPQQHQGRDRRRSLGGIRGCGEAGGRSDRSADHGSGRRRAGDDPNAAGGRRVHEGRAGGAARDEGGGGDGGGDLRRRRRWNRIDQSDRSDAAVAGGKLARVARQPAIGEISGGGEGAVERRFTQPLLKTFGLLSFVVLLM